jgi:nicotinate-nucleotide adenylyltransferase
LAAVGILGGTFDPVHYGHLIIAEAARDQLGLDRVEFLPANDPPHKPDDSVSPAADRVAMVCAAIRGIPYFNVNEVEIERTGPSFTVETLEHLKLRRPGDELVFIVGGDSLRDFPTWRSPGRIVELASLAVIQRPDARFNVEDLDERVPGLRERIHFVDTPLIEISATDLRDRIATSRSIRFQTPDNVIAYIKGHSLYTR